MATSTSTPAKKSATKKTGKPAAAKSPAAKPNNATAKRPAAPAAEAPPQKLKLVRDSFTIPKGEYAVLDELKQRAARLMRPTKKSELLRAGIAALQRMPDKAFLAAVNAVPSLKTGRPVAASAAEAEPSAKKA